MDSCKQYSCCANTTPGNANASHSYAMFHPLAYLVKLNIEMSMAELITAIALDKQALPVSFEPTPDMLNCSSNCVSTAPRPHFPLFGAFCECMEQHDSQPSDVIEKRQDFTIQSAQAPIPPTRAAEHIGNNHGVRSLRAHTKVSRAMAEKRRGHTDHSPRSGSPQMIEDLDQNDSITGTEPPWFSGRWSDVRLDGPL